MVKEYFYQEWKFFQKETNFLFYLSVANTPIRLAFCMTINKSQGQTFKKIGLYLPQPVFAHGQLYVALSRVSNFESLRIHIIDYESKQGQLKPNEFYTKNIVYDELIDKDPN